MVEASGSGVALIAGASGIVGRAAAERLLAACWRVVGVSRRPPVPSIPGLEHLPVDLGDRNAVRAALAARAGDATHLVCA